MTKRYFKKQLKGFYLVPIKLWNYAFDDYFFLPLNAINYNHWRLSVSYSKTLLCFICTLGIVFAICFLNCLLPCLLFYGWRCFMHKLSHHKEEENEKSWLKKTVLRALSNFLEGSLKKSLGNMTVHLCQVRSRLSQ